MGVSPVSEHALVDRVTAGSLGVLYTAELRGTIPSSPVGLRGPVCRGLKEVDQGLRQSLNCSVSRT